MAIALATFILAAQEILDLLYLALLFMSDQTELNSLVAKNACYAPQGISHGSLCQSWRDKQRCVALCGQLPHNATIIRE